MKMDGSYKGSEVCFQVHVSEGLYQRNDSRVGRFVATHFWKFLKLRLDLAKPSSILIWRATFSAEMWHSSRVYPIDCILVVCVIACNIAKKKHSQELHVSLTSRVSLHSIYIVH